MIMPSYRIYVLILATSLTQTLLLAQTPDSQCFSKFTKGKENFVLETDESVKDGAEFLGSPPRVTGANDCVSACCKAANCNLALMETGSQEGTIKSCFLFNCLYKQKKVCRFVRKTGFSNYLMSSVFGSYLEEYHPDEDQPPKPSAGQDRVVQPRDVVLLSGIESKDDGNIVKYEWVQVSGISTAVIEKTNFPDEVRVSGLSSGVYKFRLTVTDNVGQSESAEVTVLVLTPEQTQHHCLVPKKVGPCRGSFPRWHYNALTEMCEKFTFGGCNPNRNNYLSEKECNQACDQVSVDGFSQSTRIGGGNLPNEECGRPCGPENFTCANGCCIDKALECDQVSQCSDGSDEAQCANMDSKFRRLLNINEEDNAIAGSHCTQPPITGPCRNSHTMWYYNPYEQTCSRFNYGGCQGNNNQFDTMEKCLTFCNKVTEKDVFANRGTFEKWTHDGQSVSIALTVALCLAILILLAVLGYCCLKDRNKQPRRQHVSANGTHLLYVDDTEKLVYNSTTKPI